MDKVKVIFGSTTGNTESTAQEIAAAFGVDPVNITDATPEDFDAELLILGSSTWGCGDLQDDWATGIDMLDAIDLTGKKVAVFGQGDQCGFSDTYCDAAGILAQKAVERGAEIVGKTSAEGYQHSSSVADEGGTFVGLMLDENNQPEMSSERIAAWVEELKK